MISSTITTIRVFALFYQRISYFSADSTKIRRLEFVLTTRIKAAANTIGFQRPRLQKNAYQRGTIADTQTENYHSSVRGSVPHVVEIQSTDTSLAMKRH